MKPRVADYLKRYWRRLVAIALLLVLTGCAMFGHTNRRRSSSVMNYLYPKDQTHQDAPAIPTLTLPLKIGVAFVPEEPERYRTLKAVFTEDQGLALAQTISENFRQYPFVKSIELIPSAYLMPSGSFANLDQIRSMFGVDVVVLLSYDQIQFTDEGLLTLTYWTVVGAYVIRGERNETRTMMDAAVYDIASRKLLFRAPGTSQINGTATAVNLSEQLRRDSEQGFKEASTNLVANLQERLALLEEQVKRAPDEIRVIRSPGYTGGANLGGVEAATALVLGAWCWLGRARRP